MKSRSSIWLGAAGSILAALVMSACGGGDDDGTAPPPAPPGTGLGGAEASAASFVAYLTALPSGDESSEPVDVNAFTPPLDDGGEPAPTS